MCTPVAAKISRAKTTTDVRTLVRTYVGRYIHVCFYEVMYVRSLHEQFCDLMHFYELFYELMCSYELFYKHVYFYELMYVLLLHSTACLGSDPHVLLPSILSTYYIYMYFYQVFYVLHHISTTFYRTLSGTSLDNYCTYARTQYTIATTAPLLTYVRSVQYLHYCYNHFT